MRSEPSTRKSTVAVYLIAVRVKISTIEFAATEPRPFVWPTLKRLAFHAPMVVWSQPAHRLYHYICSVQGPSQVE
jgi:hypothetical protein